MKELSLNILDIAKNSVRAGATVVSIRIVEEKNTLKFWIKDNGCGMTEEFLKTVTDPFTTTRTTRKVGLGIPLLKLAAEQTGGSVTIASSTGQDHGTTVTALFYIDHIDCMPLGNMTDSLVTLIQGSPDVDFEFSHQKGDREVSLSTIDVRRAVGPNVPMDTPEILLWIKESLEEEYATFYL